MTLERLDQPDGERLGLPYKKFEFYLMKDGASMSLKVFKEEEREQERAMERERRFDTIRFRF